MSGAVWTISYIVLYLAVFASLSVSLSVARQLSRVLRDLTVESADTFIAEPRRCAGDRFPNIVVEDIASGSQLRPAEWETAIILQTVLYETQDIQRLHRFRDELPESLRTSTLISLNGKAEDLRQMAAGLVPLSVTVDSAHTLEEALDSKVRPYVAIVTRGTIVAVQSPERFEDVFRLITDALPAEFGIAASLPADPSPRL